MAPLALARDLLQRRALVLALARRALLTRYRGTALGFLWALLHPALLFLGYGLAFGVVARLPVERYPAFLVASLLPWTWFAQGVAIATTSILADAPFVRQTAFPAAVSPIVVALTTGAHFALGLPVLALALALLGAPPTPWLLLVPVLGLVQLALVAGLGLGLAPLCVRYRDTIQLVQAGLPILMLASPVAWPAALVPEPWAWLVRASPLARLLTAWQDVLLGRAPAPADVGLAAAAALAACLVGAAIFERLRERLPEEL